MTDASSGPGTEQFVPIGCVPVEYGGDGIPKFTEKVWVIYRSDRGPLYREKKDLSEIEELES